MGFDAPRALLLLPVLPVIAGLYWLRWSHVRGIRRQFETARHAGNPSTLLHFTVALLLLLVGCGSLIVAAAGPRVFREGQQEIYRKIDIVFLLDASLSMRARDIAPSRIRRASQEIETFIDRNREYIGRLGLVSFSGSSIVLSYLTSDPANIVFFLEHLEADDRPALGTDIGAAVKNGLSVLEKEQALDRGLEARRLIFVLVSDGEDHGGALREAVARTAQIGVRIYSVGIGTEMGDYIPVGEDNGHTLFLADEQGKQLIATFDEATLRWTAEATGGRYFRSRSGDDLQKNLGAIMQNERVVTDVQRTVHKVPLHWWFLAAGFVSLALRMTAQS